MKENDFPEFLALMATVGEAFDKKITKAKVRIYFDALEDLALDQVRQAAKYIMRFRTITGTFPLISEFFQALEHGSKGTVEDRAQLAWSKLLWGIENCGYYQSVAFDDPVIHHAIEALGGWKKITDAGNLDWYEPELKWRQKDFLQLYRALARQNREAKPYLVGYHEANNEGKYPAFVPNVLRISGDPGRFAALPEPKPKELPRPEDIKLVLAMNKLLLKE